MGQTLSEPVTAKESSYCQNAAFRVGSSCMQGWRINMEDSHTHILSLPDDPGAAFFAVYDGHGGATVAQYAGKHLHKFVLKRPEYGVNIEEALQQGFLDIDYEMLNKESWGDQMAGSTAVVVLVKDNKLYCANAGDSRAIACVNGQLEILSLDHKPNNEAESKRIIEGGGWVEFNRVNGNLALSRALGDFVFKRANKKPEDQIVTAYPDVETRKIMEDWEFIVLACDGIWDVMSNAEVLEFCRTRIGMGMHPEEICEELMNHCLAPDCQMGGLGGDNMTVVLVCLLHDRPYSDLIARCRKSNQVASDQVANAKDEESHAAAEAETEPETDTETEMQSKPCQQKQSNSNPNPGQAAPTPPPTDNDEMKVEKESQEALLAAAEMQLNYIY
ncbi:probable protein phosphatase 2C T23F11.1 [Drosophila gunungcola]|uniref:probable protein phosphatase 2C T23F11.1 n=1 Tax=Drosophila gunungcola TaxID=103775 RepID=UPI0022E0887B|nr:probable protein phosphatase 2C T23F11.1 [Drosophila gunungcola]XP_052847153.1 probable protein phosphatase 2C T23F11.1 [Drosophila gunungcola]